MPRRKYNPPDQTSSLRRYAELEEVLRNFADGKLSFAVILAKPGLSKSESTKKALQGKAARIFKGDHSHPNLYCTLYEHKDQPIVFDDTDKLMDQSWFQELLKNLTETNEFKKLEYSKRSPILLETETPVWFYTKSPVLLIMNWWDKDNALCTALESRAEFFAFEPDWYECYQAWASWFDDQDIYDYIHANLEVLKQPDARVLVKARSRKQAGMQQVSWKTLIDDHSDDQVGKEVRRLMKDESFASNNARAAKFVNLGLGDRATFYRRLKDIAAFISFGTPKPARIILANKNVVQQERPKDGPLADGSVKTDKEDIGAVGIEKDDVEEATAIPVKCQFVIHRKDGEPLVFNTLDEVVQRLTSWVGTMGNQDVESWIDKIDKQDIKSVDDLQNRIKAFEQEFRVNTGLKVTCS